MSDAVEQGFSNFQPISRNLKLEVEGGDVLNYDILQGDKNRGVLYLPNLSRTKNGVKASMLERLCRTEGRTYLCADYYGTGKSAGDFRDGTLSRWTADTISLIEELMDGGRSGKPVLVGAGVGGWLAMLVAQARPDLVGGIVGLAADPDFTEDLIWPALSEAEKATVMEEGSLDVTWGGQVYPISKALIEDGRKNLLLSKWDAAAGAVAGEVPKGSLEVYCPVRLIHGLSDEEVPYSKSLAIERAVSADDVLVVLVKDGNHFLDDDKDLTATKNAVRDCFKSFFQYDLTSPGSG